MKRFCTTGILLAAQLAWLAAPAGLMAKTPDEIRAVCRAEGRPCVGLVLSGGGARGFAHVGILEELERLGVKIDVVTGTSMGSMIGGAYASGYTAAEVEEIVRSVDWDKMLSPTPERKFRTWRTKEREHRASSSNLLEVTTEGEVTLPASVVPNQELALFLSKRTGFISGTTNLLELPIPFSAAATDLVTGKPFILREHCTVGNAMRASMSIPGVFEPVEFGGTILVDGGLVDNLPVELAREMGADVVIAVNVGTPLSGRETLGNVVGVMAQMVNILTEQNVRASLASLRPGDILITPDFGGLTSGDFKKSADIIEVGRKAAREASGELSRLAVSRTDWAAWEKNRHRRVDEAVSQRLHHVSEVRVAGETSLAPGRIIARSDIDISQPIAREDAEEATRRVWADGIYGKVTYRFEPGPNGTELLVLEPEEKTSRYSIVRVGGSIETDFDSGSNFNVLFSHTIGQINAWGGEWKNEIQIGREQYFSSEYYQPLGEWSAWFIRPSVRYSRTPYDVYEDGHAIAREKETTAEARLLLGRDISTVGYAGLQAGWLHQKSTDEIGWSNETSSYTTPFVGGILEIDTLDDLDFPTRGFRLSARGYLTEKDDSAENDNSYLIEAMAPWALTDRWVATLEGKIGRSTQRSAYRLGGARQMIGSEYGRWVGSRLEYGRISLGRNVSDIADLAVPVWIGAAAEAGRAWNPNDHRSLESASREWHKSVSLFAGINSPIGPITLMYGRTFDEGSSIYFVWGHRE